MQRETKNIKNFSSVSFNQNIVEKYLKGGLVRYDINSCRGIALVNTILKLFSKIVNNRITAEVEDMGVISKFQAGFQTGEEGIQHVCSLLEIAKRREFAGKDTYMCFIDFEKAYDNVAHDILFKKMEKIGLSAYLVNVIVVSHPHLHN